MKGIQIFLSGLALSTLTIFAMLSAMLPVNELVPEFKLNCLKLIAVSLVCLLATFRLHLRSRTLQSAVAGHLGACVPSWINSNQIDRRITGGPSGFFRHAISIKGFPFALSVGSEFHGYVRQGQVLTTEGIYGRLPN
jgi:hypothetical protein